MQLQKPGKVLVIGLDGADWRILQPFLDSGAMPNLAHMIQTGVSGTLRSTLPTNSAVAWVTFMTGQNSGQHGVFDFMQRSPHNRMRMVMVNSRSMHSETFCHVLGHHSRQVGAINIPITYPPFPVNGFLLSGMVVPEGATYTEPAGLATELDREVGGFPLNLLDWRFMLDTPGLLVEQAINVTQQRARVLQYVIENKSWDILIQVFVSPDRLQHPLMHILDPAHPRHDVSLAQQLGPKLTTYFATLDNMLGMARRSLPEDAMLIILSDHGFRSVHKSLRLKQILKEIGIITTRRGQTAEDAIRKRLRPWLGPIRDKLPRRRRKLDEVGSPMLFSDLDWSRTRAYTTTSTADDIVVNLKGREPNGIVAPGKEYENLLDDIRSQLLALRDPADRKPVIQDVVRVSDIYHGPHLNNGPDLLVVTGEGFGNPTIETGPNFAPLHSYMGAHHLDGIFLASGQGIKQGETITDASLVDLAPTILYSAGVPIPTDMDGQVLDLFSDGLLSQEPPVFESRTNRDEMTYTYDPQEDREIVERLRGLGYL